MTAKSIMQLNPGNTHYNEDAQIIIDGENTLKFTSKEDLKKIRGGKVSMIFQEPMASFAPAIKIGAQMVEQLLLHKPIDKINEILIHIKEYNSHLHLCCLMTYGCLLRPHREIRELTWEDFSKDLTYIHLSGNRNKSGRNRIVPVPEYIRTILCSRESNLNVFTGSKRPPNPSYFSKLWERFKGASSSVEEMQTLYSFRHSGAIDIFKRTGSITKLQKAMGHSSINVSLTYLRGLEIPELTEDDMPVV